MSFIELPASIHGASPDPPGPGKNIRLRLRRNCTECTRRHRKCDRKQPCSLCKTRGVEHLCEPQTESYVRPPPARPRARAATRKEKPSREKHSKEKPKKSILSRQTNNASSLANNVYHPVIQGLLPWKGVISSPSSVFLAGSISQISLNSLEGWRSYEALRDFSLALERIQTTQEDHRLDEGALTYGVTESADSVTLGPIECPLTGFPRSASLICSSERFTPILPDKERCETLLVGFHEHENWPIGIPGNVLFSAHESMWSEIRADPTSLQRFNPNWLALLLAIFAFSPACANDEESWYYFNQAVAVRKLDCKTYSSLDARTPLTDTRSAIYACLATSFLARYLLDRGRLTEAWNFVESILRDAQNAGLHRYLSPSKSKHLTNDERTFLLVGWHCCVLYDRYLSLFLGRPAVIQARDFNVQLSSALPDVLSPDGSTNTALLFQSYFIALPKIVSDSMEKVQHKASSEIPGYVDGHSYFDARMAEWLSSLPSFYKLDQPPDTSYYPIYPKLYLQRIMLDFYYSCLCLLFHRGLITAKPTNYSSSGSASQNQRQHEWDQSQLAQYAINALHAHREIMLNLWRGRQMSFAINLCMFEAAMTLGVTLLRYLYHPRADEWRRELAAAIEMIENLHARDFNKIVVQTLEVLRILQDLCDNSKAKATMGMTSFASRPVVHEHVKAFFQTGGFDNSILSTTSSNLFCNMWSPNAIQTIGPASGTFSSAGYPIEESQYSYGYPIWTTYGLTMPYIGTMTNIPYV